MKALTIKCRPNYEDIFLRTKPLLNRAVWMKITDDIYIPIAREISREVLLNINGLLGEKEDESKL